MKEKDLEIFDVWKSPNGNLFLKVSDEFSLALGRRDHTQPSKADLSFSQYVERSDKTPVKRVGKIIWDGEQENELAKKLYQMKLGESHRFSDELEVTRVIGGWIYKFFSVRGFQTEFVPWNNEYQ